MFSGELRSRRSTPRSARMRRTAASRASYSAGVKGLSLIRLQRLCAAYGASIVYIIAASEAILGQKSRYLAAHIEEMCTTWLNASRNYGNLSPGSRLSAKVQASRFPWADVWPSVERQQKKGR